MTAPRFHHLSCATMCPPLVGGEPLSCHVVLIEPADPGAGLILIDAGLGTADVADRGRALPRRFRWLVRPRLDPAETALAQIQARGLDPHDVRHVVFTHLDLDHAGGLSDFPWATAHVHARELDAARRRAGRADRARYLDRHIAGHSRWQTYGDDGEGDQWKGLGAIRPLVGLAGAADQASGELALVPLAGHTAGHAGVAMRRADRGWLLSCGDAYFHRGEIHGDQGPAPLLMRAYERILDADTRMRRANQALLSRLAAEHDDVQLFCAHDATELAALAEQSPAQARTHAPPPAPPGLARAADPY